MNARAACDAHPHGMGQHACPVAAIGIVIRMKLMYPKRSLNNS